MLRAVAVCCISEITKHEDADMRRLDRFNDGAAVDPPAGQRRSRESTATDDSRVKRTCLRHYDLSAGEAGMIVRIGGLFMASSLYGQLTCEGRVEANTDLFSLGDSQIWSSKPLTYSAAQASRIKSLS